MAKLWAEQNMIRVCSVLERQPIRKKDLSPFLSKLLTIFFMEEAWFPGDNYVKISPVLVEDGNFPPFSNSDCKKKISRETQIK